MFHLGDVVSYQNSDFLGKDLKTVLRLQILACYGVESQRALAVGQKDPIRAGGEHADSVLVLEPGLAPSVETRYVAVPRRRDSTISTVYSLELCR